MQESLGNQRGCTKMWTQKERIYLSQEKMGERRAGKGGSCVIQQAKGSLVRSDSWHKEKRKSKIKQESIEALQSRGGFHSFPGHCAVQSVSPGQRNLPSLIPSFPLFLPSSLLPFLSHQVLPWPCRHRNQELTALPPLV